MSLDLPPSRLVHVRLDRRKLLRSFLLSAGGLITSANYAEALALVATPSATEGPYYPDHLPLDQDNDLTQISQGAKAEGIVTHFGGRLLDLQGRPIQDAKIEIWQADAKGCYIHSRGVQRGKERDPKFQGYGTSTTNSKGEYLFKTIKPGFYTGRTLHWHVAVVKNGKKVLTTQLYIAGIEQNERDGVLRRMGTEEQRLSVIREFKPKSAEDSELYGTWDIVLGKTPADL